MTWKQLVSAVLVTWALTTAAFAQTGVIRNQILDVDEETITTELKDIESVGISVVGSGTYELRFEASADGGTTYRNVGTVNADDYSRDTSTTAPGTWWFGNLGDTHFRVRVESYTSGAPVVKLVRGYGNVTAPLSAGSVSGANDAASATGSAVPSSASYTGIRVGSNLVGQTGFTVGSSNGAAVAIIDGSGNQITSFGGGTQYTEADTDASISGTAMLMEGAANALVPAQGTAADGLLVNLGANNDVTISGTVTVGSHAVTNAGTFATQAAQSGTWTVQPGNTANTTPWLVAGNVTPADNMSPTTAVPVTNYNMCFDGTNWDRCTISSGGSGTIDANTGRVTIATDDPLNDAAVKTDANMVAHDAADAGNPLKVGAKASTGNSARTPVANNDRTDVYADADGVLLTRQNSPLADRVSAVVGVTDGSSTSLVAAQGSGIRFCATAITVSNSSATNVTVDLRDGTAGSVIWTFPAAANMGGATLSFLTPLCTTANTILAMDPSAAATTVTVSVIGFKTAL